MQEVERKKIAVGDLKLGMYVSELDRPWSETAFLFQGFPISTDDELTQLRACCDYVYIDLRQSKLWVAEQPKAVRRDYESSWLAYTPPDETDTGNHRFATERLNIEPAMRPHPAPDTATLAVNVEAVRRVHSKAHEYVGQMLADARLGQSLDVAAARTVVHEMVDAIVADENALVWLTQLKSRDEYTTLHSINVCILALLFGRHLGYDVEQLNEIGHGALLHDIGKMKVPLAILNKPTAPTAEELALLKQHPSLGYELLKESKSISPAALDIVYSHHERVDGSGYPRGLQGDQIGEYALLVSVVDVYDAITSDRVYHLGISPHEALNLMYQWAHKSFPSHLLEEFIKCLGIYPIGSIVELNTGEVGVVMTVNRRHHLRPIITLVLDTEKHPYPTHKLINLELYGGGPTPVNIRKILESNAYGVDVRSIIMGSRRPAG